MGYYNRLEVGEQENVDKIVRWYRDHRDVLPPYLLNMIVNDEEFLGRAMWLWEGLVPEPKPAAEHVALQEPVVRRRQLREPKRSRMCVAGWSLIGVALVASVALVVVNL